MSPAAPVVPAPVVVAVGVLSVAFLVRAGARAARRDRAARRLSRVTPGRGTGGGLVAAVERIVGSLPAPPASLAPRLVEADLPVDPAGAWAAWLMAVTVCGLGALAAGGPALAGLVVAALTVVPLAALRARRGRAGERIEAGLPAALETIARSLRSGASLRQAMAEAGATVPGPLGAELRAVATRTERGMPQIAALEELGARRPSPGVRLAVAALCLGVETGGAQARAVDGVASTLRERAGVAAEVRALSSQARISALVIGLAPVGFGAFAAASDPELAAFVFRTPAGIAILAAGLGLDGLGWLWMNRLARVRP